VYSQVFPALASRWYLYKVKDMDLVSVFCRQIPSFPSNICWRDCLFLIVYFGQLCQKSGGHNWVFYSIPLVFSSFVKFILGIFWSYYKWNYFSVFFLKHFLHQS
jgi:hypothetical protein